MPAELKRLLTEEVGRSGRSLNDVAVGLLASRFGVSFDPSGRPGREPGKSGSVLLRMPPELKDKLTARAAQRKRNLNDLIVETLSERLGKEPMAATNGKVRRSEDKVRVAIVGVGNCASALVQGVEYYKDADPDAFVPGLMHVDLGGYHIRDVEFTAAFDVTTDKVGKDLSEAIWAQPNNTIKFSDVPKAGVTVSRGMTHDGLGKYLSEVVTKAPGETDDVVGILRDTKTDVVINYLPVGSEEATKWYTEQILSAGCAMVNCMPVFIARENYWQRRFEERGLPIIGDDIKSQVGATITHRVLASIFRDRGVRLDRTFQLNFGGNSDFMNMLERDRLESKKISKTNAIISTLPYELEEKNVHVGPSDYVPWLEDRKWAYIRLEGTSFGDVPLNAELKIEVWDSPNSAGVVIDAVRLAKLALNNGVAGTLEGPSSYLMKSPPVQHHDDEARDLTEEFIHKHARKQVKEPAQAKA
jgi:myo-inositol-1-phosphate synthase